MILLLEGIAKTLHEAGIGTFDVEDTEGNIFIGHMPKKPDIAIGIYPSEGLQDDLWNDTQYPAVQVLMRGNGDVRTALNMADRVYNELSKLSGTHMDGLYVINCVANTYSPVNLGLDASGRFECVYTFRFEIMREVI